MPQAFPYRNQHNATSWAPPVLPLGAGFFAILLIFAANAADLRTTILYVALDGKDSDPATQERPVATLVRARDLVREMIARGLTSDVQVLVRGGTYYLPEPLIFDHRDSGTPTHSITYAAYPGEKVVLSGGRPITGWKKQENHLWSVVIPQVKSNHWYFRDLYVNGLRAVRARQPNFDQTPPYWELSGSSLKEDLSSWEVKLKPGQLANWKNLTDVEIALLHTFVIYRKYLLAVDSAAGTALLKPPHVKLRSHNLPRAGTWCYLENAFAFLDQPGEWYLDRNSGELRYWPRDGEELSQTNAVAPVLNRVIQVKGDAGQPVQNLHFKGLTVSHAAWNPPAWGFNGTQAGFYLSDKLQPPLPKGIPPPIPYPPVGFPLRARMDAAVSFEFAQDCSYTEGEISHVGGVGLELRRGCSRNVIQGNRIFDIAGTGIMIGEDINPNSSLEFVTKNTVADNLIHDCGTTYHCAVGLWCGFASDTIIVHNELHSLPYSGVSVGWVWGPEASQCQKNLIAYNHIHHVIQLLSDAGGIYTLGRQPGTTIRANYIHDLGNPRRLGHWAFGLYFDEGSTLGFLVESNVVNNVTGWPVKTANAPTWRGGHTWRDNVLSRREPLTEGLSGAGLLFDHDTYLQAESSDALEPVELTLEAWVKFHAFPKDPDPTVWIINKNSNEFTNGYYALVVSHRNVGAYLNIGGGRDNCFSTWSQTAPVPSDTSAWTHLAMTYDGRDLKVYCNGVFQNSTPIHRARTRANGPLRIGKRADDYGEPFIGVMDEIAIYNRALSAEEIRHQYSLPINERVASRPPSGCVARWRFDDLQQRMAQAMRETGPREPFRSRLRLNKPDAQSTQTTERIR